MKIAKTIFSLGIVIGTTIASLSGFAASIQDFTLVNNTGWTVFKVFVSETTNKSWEQDVLGKGVLIDGASKPITFKGYAKNVCKFDIKVEDRDKKSWVINNVDLCATSTVTIRMRDGRLVYTTK